MNRTGVSRRGGTSLGAQFIFTSTIFLLVHSMAFGQPYVHERSFGTVGSGPGQFEQITGLDQDSQGNYVILDGYVGEFQICTGDGICEEHDTAAKALNEHGNQWGLAVNSQDDIFITNQFGYVEKCTKQEEWECAVFLNEHEELPIYPWGIAIDQNDRIYISDVSYSRILVCDSDGNCSSFGTWGNELGQFNSPYALAINAKNQVVIADAGNLRVQACDHRGNCEATRYDNSHYYYSGGYGQGFVILPSGAMITTGYGYAHVNACAPGGACRVVTQYDYNNPNYLQNPAAVIVNEDGRLVIGGYGAVYFLRPNVTINPGINDAWIEAGILGQGLLVSVLEDIPLVFVAWFTYDSTRPDGLSDPEIGDWGHRWVTMQGGYTGNVANLVIYLTKGGVFESAYPPPDDAVPIGEATLTIHDCRNATLEYSFTNTNRQGVKKLVRIVGDNVPNCQVLSGD